MIASFRNGRCFFCYKSYRLFYKDCFPAGSGLANTGKMQQHAAKDYGIGTG